MSTEWNERTQDYERPETTWTPVPGDYSELVKRGISEATCRKAGYQVAPGLHIMNWRDTFGKLLAQKFRTQAKEFAWVGQTEKLPFYLQWLWPAHGKSVTITEGEVDALSVLEAFDRKWPVVSFTNGTGSVRKDITNWYDWLAGYDKIVLMLDQDEPGRKAVEEAVELLPPGKVWIARQPEGCKDANDTLRSLGPAAVLRSFYDAVLYRPEGIVAGTEFTRERLKKSVPAGYPLPWPKLQEQLLGLRKGELTLLTAGSGVGKSTLARELAYYLATEHRCKIANIFLEEANDITARGYVAIHNNVPLGRLNHDPDLVADEHWDDALRDVVHPHMWFYNHFGSIACDTLISKLLYFARVCGADFSILDHFSIVTSGLESSSEGERKDIDILMTRSQQVIQMTGMGIIGVVHLKRPPGAAVSFNEGGQVNLQQLRGSGSLEQLSNNVIALERNQQDEDEVQSCVEQLRVLKCRETGYTGLSDELIYDRETGRLQLYSSSFRPEAEGMQSF